MITSIAIKKWTVGKDVLRCSLFFLPFTEPYIIDRMILIGNNTLLWSTTGWIFTIGRFVVTLLCILLMSSTNKRSSSVKNCCYIYLLSILLASFFNGSVGIRIFLFVYNSIGVILLCQYLGNLNPVLFYRTLKSVFGLYSFAAIATALIWPNGFNNAAYKHDALFLLGGKNASFFYYILYLFSASLYGCHTGDRKIHNKCFWISIVMILSACIFDSAGTIISIIPATAYFFLSYHQIDIYKMLRYQRMLLLTGMTSAMILSGVVFNNSIIRRALEVFVGLFGKSIHFTGRVYLWDIAIDYFRNNILFGMGLNTVYDLGHGNIQTQSHSFYLELLSKHGIIAFICFCFVFIAIGMMTQKVTRVTSQYLIVVVIFCTLIHSITEDANQLLLFMIIMLCDSVGIKKAYTRGLLFIVRRECHLTDSHSQLSLKRAINEPI